MDYSKAPYSTPYQYPSTPEERERIRREQEELWTNVAGVVVGGAVIFGCFALAARFLR